jgi:GTP-binding protein
VFDKARGKLLRDLTQVGQRLVVAAGGAGGQGNARFANSIRQTPHFATEGKKGEERLLHLELKLFAEVGSSVSRTPANRRSLARSRGARPRSPTIPSRRSRRRSASRAERDRDARASPTSPA